MLVAALSTGCVKYKPYEPVNLPTLNWDSVSLNTYLPGKWQFVEDRTRDINGKMVYNTPRTRRYEKTVEVKGDTLTLSTTGVTPFIVKYKLRRQKYYTLYQYDDRMVVGYNWLNEPQKFGYFYVSINQEYLMFHFSIYADGAADIIYKRIY